MYPVKLSGKRGPARECARASLLVKFIPLLCRCDLSDLLLVTKIETCAYIYVRKFGEIIDLKNVCNEYMVFLYYKNSRKQLRNNTLGHPV